ncbi:hypothetical protein AAFN88_18920 [Pelagibius sp. CAU 1746]|uniref:hypothetical protein n=1 Tax=Pelagibius sp. CAU 1746 TaxID=3140370 RepID=UPI00325B4A62
MTTYRDDSTEADPLSIPAERLRGMIRARDAKTDRQPLLAALRLRSDITPAEKVVDFAAVLRDREESPSLRFTAAAELGRLSTRESRAALAEALSLAAARDEPEIVVRGAACALLTDDAADPEEIAAAIAERPELARSLRFPLTLFALRHDLAPEELNAPPLDLGSLKGTRVRKEEARPMAVLPASPEVVSRIAAGAAPILGAAELDPRTVTCLQCGDQQLAVAVTAGTLSERGLLRLQRRRGVIGVVSVHYHLESDSWEPKYALTTRPGAKKGTLELILLDTAGTPAFLGEAAVNRSEVRFSLKALRKPGAIPARLKGRVRQGRLEFDEALSELHKIGRRKPRRLAPPKR